MKRFDTGNHAAIEAALAAGCKFFAGYPITPSTEALEKAAETFPEHGRVFVPTEGEIAAINMMAGASLAGFRVMTATSGLGFSLMSEGLSFFSGMTELPGVVLLQQRWGPGDGSLGPGQDGYFQATRGAGHGDFSLIVLAPASVQEMVDHVGLAFELADRYSMYVVILGDQIIAASSEIYTVGEPAEPQRREVAFGNAPVGEQRVVLPELVAADEKAGDFAAIQEVARKWERKYHRIRQHEQRYEYVGPDGDLDLLVVAFGSLARIAIASLSQLTEAFGRVGVFRPVTVWPFPEAGLEECAERTERVVVAELNMGQMLTDVRTVLPRRGVEFVNWLGGVTPTPESLAASIEAGSAKVGAR